MKKRLKIGFIGNFQVPYTTENDRKWSLEKLGHEVITFQENLITLKDLKQSAPMLDLLLYSHTHDPSYSISGLKEFFILCLDNGLPTASVHLDRWVGLKRETDIGNEATWFTEYQFMADFSPEAQELYKKHNLNAYYLKPGVVERDCYMAEPDHVKYPHEIIFVGSKGYHPEYPFRPKLIEFLQGLYGDKFSHYGNDGIAVVRGDDLNMLYASAKIVVGDSCFGGRPNYVSDRYYETRGRGGFLLHPYIPGVDNTGVGHYIGGDLINLKQCINYFLSQPDLIETMRKQGHEHVKNNETYTHRMQEMLEVIFK